MIICGHGPAGAVAQHATLLIQQHLRALTADQASCCNNPLCHTLITCYLCSTDSLSCGKTSRAMSLAADSCQAWYVWMCA